VTAPHSQARTPAEAYWALDPFEKVLPNDPWFVDLESLVPQEHYGVTRKLQRNLGKALNAPDFVHVGLMGHSGTGKTTLARNAIATLSGDGITPVYIDAMQAFDQTDFTFSDVVLVLAEAVIAHLEERALTVGHEQLETVRSWFAEELVSVDRRSQLLGSVETSAEGGITVPLVAKLAGKVTSALKSDTVYRQEIRQRAERDPRELIRRTNLLLDAVHAALAPRKAKLCVVFDNLEKTRPELVDRALLQRAEEFRQLRTNTLLFFNPLAEYSPIGIQVSRAFECTSVPVLPVRFPGDGPDVVRPEAKRAIERMLDVRLVLSVVFEDPDACIHALAHWSGGHISDLLQIARRAVENVEPKRVTVADIEKAARFLGGRRLSSLRPEDLPRAAKLHRTHQILDTEQDRRMLRTSCVLAYDGTEWWDVHPAIRAIDLFQQALRADAP
jgi:hypothetical protein